MLYISIPIYAIHYYILQTCINLIHIKFRSDYFSDSLKKNNECANIFYQNQDFSIYNIQFFYWTFDVFFFIRIL